MEIRAYITNLGLYNEGILCGEWVSFPIDEEEESALKQRIRIDALHEEYFITDYETDVDIRISEYTSISELNTIAEALEDLSDYEQEIVSVLLGDGYSLEDALDKKDDCYIYYDCSTMEEVAERYAEETCLLDSIPENLRYYFDFEAFGRDLDCEGHYVFTDSGNCVCVNY